ncbi:hypothetical protein [Bythopirellula polymerisocia]|uniref:hypothetical protein n=1 Tax=Bythopirellula polymerisocia TaxID=2528003 RepID=UPI0011B4EEFF|nr:hypothetical protein [Bythopirellula polymerisocia]
MSSRELWGELGIRAPLRWRCASRGGLGKRHEEKGAVGESRLEVSPKSMMNQSPFVTDRTVRRGAGITARRTNLSAM